MVNASFLTMKVLEAVIASYMMQNRLSFFNRHVHFNTFSWNTFSFSHYKAYMVTEIGKTAYFS